jgi:hypothetical protein
LLNTPWALISVTVSLVKKTIPRRLKAGNPAGFTIANIGAIGLSYHSNSLGKTKEEIKAKVYV